MSNLTNDVNTAIHDQLDHVISEIAKYCHSHNEFLTHLKGYDSSILFPLKLRLERNYYLGNSELPDEFYDILEEYVNSLPIEIEGEEKNEEEELLTKRRKVLLPLFMDSLEKYKPGDTKLLNWVKRFHGSYLIMPKLDGISCLIKISRKAYPQMYTKGSRLTGYGLDISDLSFVLPKTLRKTGDYYVRGELIMSEKVFAQKYKDLYKNTRALVSGAVTSLSTSPEILKDIRFVAYEFYEQGRKLQTKSKQLELLREKGFEIVPHHVLNELNDSELTRMVLEYKKEYEYYVDGIVVYHENEYDRNGSGLPDYSFAYKIMSDQVQAIVEFVEWNISKKGLYKPRIKLQSVDVGGVEVNYTSGFNGKYIETNKIGNGTVVLLTRSGDVIPYIVRVLKCSEKADMPENYKWDENHVEILTTEENGEEQQIKLLESFFKALNVEYLGAQTIKKIYYAGYTDLVKIYMMSVEDLSTIDGFGQKLAQKIYDNLGNSLENVSVAKLLDAGSVIPDLGQRRIELLLKEIPDFFDRFPSVDRIKEIHGFSDILAKKIFESYESCIAFLEMMKTIGYNAPIIEEQKGEDLKGQKFVFSGFRDAELEAKIKSRGGEVSSSVSKNTTVLLVKDLSESSSKIQKARELGVPIKLKFDFLEWN